MLVTAPSTLSMHSAMKRIVSTTAGRSILTTSRDGLAHVERLEHGERLGVLVDERGEAVHDFHARARRHLRPAARLERLARRRDGAIDVLGRAGGDSRRTFRPSPGLTLVNRPPFLASTNLPSMKRRVSSLFCGLRRHGLPAAMVMLFAAVWMLIRACLMRSGSASAPAAARRSRIDDGATVRVDDHGVQVNFDHGRRRARRRAPRSARPRGRIPRRRAVARWRRLDEQRRDAELCDESRGLGRVERRQRRRPRRRAPRRARRRAPITTTGPNCASCTMPSSISTPRAAIIGATSARGTDARGEIAPGGGDRGLVGKAEMDAVQVASCDRCRASRSSARPGTRARCAAARASRLALDDAAGVGRQARLAEQRQRIVLVEARRGRRAARGSVRGRAPAVRGAGAAARATKSRWSRRWRTPRRKDSSPSSTGNPSRVASTIMRIGARALACSRRGMPACRWRDGRRAGSRCSPHGCRRPRRDRARRRRARACGSLMSVAKHCCILTW